MQLRRSGAARRVKRQLPPAPLNLHNAPHPGLLGLLYRSCRSLDHPEPPTALDGLSSRQLARDPRPAGRPSSGAGLLACSGPMGKGKREKSGRDGAPGAGGGDAGGAAAAMPAGDMPFARHDCGLCKQTIDTESEEYLAGAPLRL